MFTSKIINYLCPSMYSLSKLEPTNEPKFLPHSNASPYSVHRESANRPSERPTSGSAKTRPHPRMRNPRWTLARISALHVQKKRTKTLAQTTLPPTCTTRAFHCFSYSRRFNSSALTDFTDVRSYTAVRQWRQ